MSAPESARLHVQSLLARSLTMAGARESLGIAGASEIWGGVAPRDKPGWYLWIAARPGAYGLDLEDAESADVEGEAVVRAQLSVRYYPSPAEPAFGGFSSEERTIATGGWFDSSGAPHVLRASEIPPALFLIGAVELVFDAERATRAVTVGAPERLGEVPAWELAAPFFATIAGVVAQVERRSATRLVEADGPSHRSALVLFDPAASCGHGHLAYLDADARVVRNQELTRWGEAGAAGACSSSIPVAASWFAAGPPAVEHLGCCR